MKHRYVIYSNVRNTEVVFERVLLDIFINVSASGLVLGSLGNFFCVQIFDILKFSLKKVKKKCPDFLKNF